jgi:uncharacterized SAM-binding protein YcdF (DUF218 family)
MLRAQLHWVLVGAVVGFLPWVLLSAIPNGLGVEPIPARYTLLTAVFAPICVLFAIRRYRLLDVGSVLDWVLVHGLLVVGFLVVEVLALSWLTRRFPATGAEPTAIVVNALILGLSVKTVSTHREHILGKLAGHDSSETLKIWGQNAIAGINASGFDVYEEAMKLHSPLRRNFANSNFATVVYASGGQETHVSNRMSS